jgi:hypothetical protein
LRVLARGADEGVFYCYCYPEPGAFRSYPLAVRGATYDERLGEFVLPHALVRAAADPDEYLLTFLRATYAAAVTTARWP